MERKRRMSAQEKVLVVDDEPSIWKYLQTLLEVDGFEVETLSSGREAIKQISEGKRPDFVILDVLMPEMNGIDTLKELMQLDRTLNVIMLSCSNEVGTVVEAIRIGAHDYLTKPFEKTELDAAMLKSRQKKQLATANPAADPANRSGGRAGFYLWRKRRGTRSCRADDSLAFEAAQPGVCESELRGAAGKDAAIVTVRIRARRLYWCREEQA